MSITYPFFTRTGLCSAKKGEVYEDDEEEYIYDPDLEEFDIPARSRRSPLSDEEDTPLEDADFNIEEDIDQLLEGDDEDDLFYEE